MRDWLSGDRHDEREAVHLYSDEWDHDIDVDGRRGAVVTAAKHRLWRTAAGELVGDGHPDAVSLAYAEGDELAGDDAMSKAALKAGDKAVKAAPNKAK